MVATQCPDVSVEMLTVPDDLAFVEQNVTCAVVLAGATFSVCMQYA
ncbi:hypothetical protein K788_0001663 (plasmid) [Paraburkholderia caribensis MBA4]|uniref:Uncharacterized protein n=1 Tax=Paraburkholderia caribensis MBA4 TaxID=1323664 RepID=A0A0P0RMS4_9BURK|nr:hypothetical protein K788_0001663 [Paraburkholderia caribensis MBA4]